MIEERCTFSEGSSIPQIQRPGSTAHIVAPRVQQLKLVMDSIVWAFRHTERNVAETGLNLLLEMLGNFQVSHCSASRVLVSSLMFIALRLLQSSGLVFRRSNGRFEI